MSKHKNKVFAWIEKAISEVKQFLGLVPKNVRIYTSRSLAITANIKAVLDSPVTDIITAIIPGTWDEALVGRFREYLHKTMPYLLIVDSCKQFDALEDMLQCWVTELRKLPVHSQNALLIKLAALLTALQDNNQSHQRLYDLWAQAEYTGEKQ